MSEFKSGIDYVTDISSGFTILAYEDMISENFKLWKPAEDEWCVFWDNSIIQYDIRRFDYTAKNVVSNEYVHYEKNGLVYTNIAPLNFIQTLKELKT